MAAGLYTQPPHRAKARAQITQGKIMSRTSLILIAVAVLIVAGLVVLANINTEVPPVRVEKAVSNEALAH
jgi:hypothetical protein